MDATQLAKTAARLVRDADRIHAHTKATFGDAMSDQEAAARDTAAALLRKAAHLAHTITTNAAALRPRAGHPDPRSHPRPRGTARRGPHLRDRGQREHLHQDVATRAAALRATLDVATLAGLTADEVTAALNVTAR